MSQLVEFVSAVIVPTYFHLLIVFVVTSPTLVAYDVVNPSINHREAGGTKGSALCGALPSTPPVAPVGEHTSWDVYQGDLFTPSRLFWLWECHSLERIPGDFWTTHT